jgi:hypothetical protein
MREKMKMLNDTSLLSSPGGCDCVGRSAGLSPASVGHTRIGHVVERGGGAGVFSQIIRRGGRCAMRTVVIASDGSAKVYDELGQNIETYGPGSMTLPRSAPGGLFESQDEVDQRENDCAEAWPY